MYYHILSLRIDMQSTHAFHLLGENASNVQDQPTIILNPLPAVTPLKTGFALLSRFAFIDSLKICGCVFSWRAGRAAISAMESWGNWTCNFLIPIMNDPTASRVQMMNVRNQSCFYKGCSYLKEYTGWRGAALHISNNYKYGNINCSVKLPINTLKYAIFCIHFFKWFLKITPKI